MQKILERTGRISYDDVEVGVTPPRYRPTRLETEQSQEPLLVDPRPPTAELAVESHFDNLDLKLLCLRADQLRGSRFTRAYDLVLVEQEHRDTCGVHQFAHLSLAGAHIRAGVTVRRSLPHTVRLIADQHVKTVVFRGHETVEVLEQRLHARVATARDFPERFRERLRARGVHRRSSLPPQLTQQR